MAEWSNCEEDYLQVKRRQDWGTTCVCPTCGGLSRTDTGIKHRKQTAAETLSTSVRKHTGSFCSSKHWAKRMQKHKRNILLLLTFSRAANQSLIHGGGVSPSYHNDTSIFRPTERQKANSCWPESHNPPPPRPNWPMMEAAGGRRGRQEMNGGGTGGSGMSLLMWHCRIQVIEFPLCVCLCVFECYTTHSWKCPPMGLQNKTQGLTCSCSVQQTTFIPALTLHQHAAEKHYRNIDTGNDISWIQTLEPNETTKTN